MTDLLAALLFLLTAWALYTLLKRVNGPVALLFLLLNVCGVAMQCFSLILLYAALPLPTAGGQLDAFTADQRHASALFFLGLHEAGFTGAQLFFAAWTLPLGYLVYRSGFLPKALGVLLMLDGLALSVWFVQATLLPDYAAISYPSFAVSFVAEVSLALWLVVKGAQDPAPNRAATG